MTGGHSSLSTLHEREGTAMKDGRTVSCTAVRCQRTDGMIIRRVCCGVSEDTEPAIQRTIGGDTVPSMMRWRSGYDAVMVTVNAVGPQLWANAERASNESLS